MRGEVPRHSRPWGRGPQEPSEEPPRSPTAEALQSRDPPTLCPVQTPTQQVRGTRRWGEC